MMTFLQFAHKPESIPAATAWYLADLSEARGKQDLYTKQSPQKLKALRENAMIESAVSSNRIEGVTVDQARIRTILFGEARRVNGKKPKSPKGAKAEMVLNSIRAQRGEFRIVDIERACPGVGREWIRTLLASLKKSGEVKCHGKGPAAKWVYEGGKGSTLK